MLNSHTIEFAVVFLLAFSISVATVPIFNWLSRRFNIVSQPGGRRQERNPMPKLGGAAIFTGFVAGILVAQALDVPRQDPNEIIRFVGLLLGSLVIFVVGVLDDVFELSYFPAFLGQFSAAAIAILFQVFIEFFNNPLTGDQTDPWPFFVTVALTLFWYVAMMNTTNFLDGLDGLAAGVALIAGTMLFLNSAFRLEPPQISISLLPLALMGACAGFLLYNFHPARTYMGGSALFLGFVLAALSIIGGAKMATILLVMGLPLMDLAWQAFNRLLKGRNPFRGDRGHVHFRLLDRGLMTHRQIVLAYYLFCSFFGALTLILESQLYKFIAFSVMLVLIAVGFYLLARLQAPAVTSQSSSSS